MDDLQPEDNGIQKEQILVAPVDVSSKYSYDKMRILLHAGSIL